MKKSKISIFFFPITMYSKLNTGVSLFFLFFFKMLPAFSQKYPHLRLFQLKFRYSEKAKKNVKNLPFCWTLLSNTKKVGRFFQTFLAFCYQTHSYLSELYMHSYLLVLPPRFPNYPTHLIY